MLNKLVKLIPIFYKDLSPNLRGRYYGLWIYIDKKYKGRNGLLAHERCHARQLLKTLGLHGILYPLSKRWKYKTEVEAFGYSIYAKERNKVEVKRTLIIAYKIPKNIMRNYEREIDYAVFKASLDFEELI